ncbi:MAG: hypothetical protein RL244_2524 [Pseudomonadota bacterium]|jgi:uncharacterized protein YjbJ (UPF0337 family)
MKAMVALHLPHSGKSSHPEAKRHLKNIMKGNDMTAINKDTIEGNWKQFKGKVKEQWGKLTDDDLDVIAGKRDQLVGRLQERAGIARDEAEQQVKDWEDRNPDWKWL